MSAAGIKGRVFILGAGATKSHTGGLAPLVTEFFAAAARHEIDFDNPSLPWSWRELRELAAKYNVVFRSPTDRTNLEDLFTFLEIEIDESPAPRLLGARRQLIRLVQEVFDGVALRFGSSTGDYAHFAAGLGENDTVISFNWDVFLDDQLHRRAVLARYYGERRWSYRRSSTRRSGAIRSSGGCGMRRSRR